MRVAFVNQPFGVIRPPVENADSIGLWIYNVARRLAGACEVVVYGRRGREDREVEGHEGVLYRRVLVRFDRLARYLEGLDRRGVRPARRPFFASRVYSLPYIWKVAADLRARGCEVVHVSNFSQYVPVVRALNPDARIVLHMHCEWLTQLDAALVEPRLRQADLVVGCSEYITGKIRDRFPHLADRCRTVHNGVDLDRFAGRSGDRPGALGTGRLLFVGRVSPEKGVHVLADAFARVADRFPGAELEIAGPEAVVPREFAAALSDDPLEAGMASFYEGSYLEHVRGRLSDALRQRVRFTGLVPQARLADHYRRAEVFVLPSVWNEPFGLPVLEAMAAGLPVVATRGGAFPETVEHERTGLLVRRGEAGDLAEAIARLLGDPYLRERMGTAGRERAVDRFSWERTAGELSSLYAEIRGARRRRGSRRASLWPRSDATAAATPAGPGRPESAATPAPTGAHSRS